MRFEAYNYMNEFGAINTRHDFKVQVERMLSIIVVEEASNNKKIKSVFIEECAATISKQLSSGKNSQKACFRCCYCQY